MLRISCNSVKCKVENLTRVLQIVWFKTPTWNGVTHIAILL